MLERSRNQIGCWKGQGIRLDVGKVKGIKWACLLVEVIQTGGISGNSWQPLLFTVPRWPLLPSMIKDTKDISPDFAISRGPWFVTNHPLPISEIQDRNFHKNKKSTKMPNSLYGGGGGRGCWWRTFPTLMLTPNLLKSQIPYTMQCLFVYKHSHVFKKWVSGNHVRHAQ